MNLAIGMHAKMVGVCHTPFYAEYTDNSYDGMEPATFFFKTGSKYIIDIKVTFDTQAKGGFMPFDISAIALVERKRIYLEPWQLHLFLHSNFIEHQRVVLQEIKPAVVVSDIKHLPEIPVGDQQGY